jgi:hypothetical protein
MRLQERWTSLYRLALQVLPIGLRLKHGPAMERLFAQELARARERGRLTGALAGAAGLSDVVGRGVYERVRAVRASLRALRGERAQGSWTPRQVLNSANLGALSMPDATTRRLLRRHAAAFAVSFMALTGLLLALFAVDRLPLLSARGAPVGTLVEVLLLSLPPSPPTTMTTS